MQLMLYRTDVHLVKGISRFVSSYSSIIVGHPSKSASFFHEFVLVPLVSLVSSSLFSTSRTSERWVSKRSRALQAHTEISHKLIENALIKCPWCVEMRTVRTRTSGSISRDSLSGFRHM